MAHGRARPHASGRAGAGAAGIPARGDVLDGAALLASGAETWRPAKRASGAWR
jgi:hypothetical protein